MLESWARCVQYVLTNQEYKELGVFHKLPAYPENGSYNFQAWNPQVYDRNYTPLFIDWIMQRKISMLHNCITKPRKQSTDYSLSMKTKPLFISTILMGLLAVLCGCGTEGKGAYVHLTTVLIKNNSMYDIEIVVEKPSTVLMTGTFTVKNGTTFKIEKASEGGYYVTNPLEAQIKFDDGTAITHREMDAYHNFCSHIAFEKNASGKRSVEYTFEFTDEDYEYAKKHADKTKI